MEPAGILFLVVSAVISFSLGRFFVRKRDKKRQEKAEVLAARLRREQPPEPVSNNKAKRKRQLQQHGRQNKP